MADVIKNSLDENNNHASVLFQRAKDVIAFELDEAQDLLRVARSRMARNQIEGNTQRRVFAAGSGGLLVQPVSGNDVDITAGHVMVGGYSLVIPAGQSVTLATPGADTMYLVYLQISETEVADPAEVPELGETTLRRRVTLTFGSVASTTGLPVLPASADDPWLSGGSQSYALGLVTVASGDDPSDATARYLDLREKATYDTLREALVRGDAALQGLTPTELLAVSSVTPTRKYLTKGAVTVSPVALVAGQDPVADFNGPDALLEALTFLQENQLEHLEVLLQPGTFVPTATITLSQSIVMRSVGDGVLVDLQGVDFEVDATVVIEGITFQSTTFDGEFNVLTTATGVRRMTGCQFIDCYMIAGVTATNLDTFDYKYVFQRCLFHATSASYTRTSLLEVAHGFGGQFNEGIAGVPFLFDHCKFVVEGARDCAPVFLNILSAGTQNTAFGGFEFRGCHALLGATTTSGSQADTVNCGFVHFGKLSTTGSFTFLVRRLYFDENCTVVANHELLGGEAMLLAIRSQWAGVSNKFFFADITVKGKWVIKRGVSNTITPFFIGGRGQASQYTGSVGLDTYGKVTLEKLVVGSGAEFDGTDLGIPNAIDASGTVWGSAPVWTDQYTSSASQTVLRWGFMYIDSNGCTIRDVVYQGVPHLSSGPDLHVVSRAFHTSETELPGRQRDVVVENVSIGLLPGSGQAYGGGVEPYCRVQLTHFGTQGPTTRVTNMTIGHIIADTLVDAGPPYGADIADGAVAGGGSVVYIAGSGGRFILDNVQVGNVQGINGTEHGFSVQPDGAFDITLVRCRAQNISEYGFYYQHPSQLANLDIFRSITLEDCDFLENGTGQVILDATVGTGEEKHFGRFKMTGCRLRGITPFRFYPAVWQDTAAIFDVDTLVHAPIVRGNEFYATNAIHQPAILIGKAGAIGPTSYLSGWYTENYSVQPANTNAGTNQYGGRAIWQVTTPGAAIAAQFVHACRGLQNVYSIPAGTTLILGYPSAGTGDGAGALMADNFGWVMTLNGG